MSYNGWTNKETWLVNLWLGDTLTMDQEYGHKIDAAFIESFVEEMADGIMDNDSGFIRDLLNCALGEINYHELAKHYETEGESE